MKMTRRNFLSASALTLLSCQLAPAARADCLLSGLFHGADTALPPKPLTAKVVDANPFMGRSESNIHHDCYNTDSTDAVLPVGICPEVNVAMEKTNPNASPAIFFDNFDNPVSPFLGGLAIRDLDAEEVRTIGFFSPAKHDGGGYLIQSSYSFVDGRNLIVCPTSHNHVLMLRATDEKGTPLPVFEKVLDINIKEAAERVLGRSLEQNLLSIVFDYDGNLWFVTGGFRIYPSRGQQGAMGYISHNAIDAILAGGTADLDHEVHVYAPAPGEGAENGIASCREGAVILTNLACYLLRANGGVEVVWRTPYDSVGAKDSREGAATTGGGLAWGGGMWQYIVLDFDTGKTVLTVDVASLYGYNNMAIGMYAGRDGNKLYCPTGYKELLRLQDRFVFLPEMPYRKVDLDKTSRRVLSAAEFQAAGGTGTPASWLHTATLDNLHPATTVSFRINGLTGNAADYKLFALGTDGRYHEVSDWHFDDAPARLSAKKVYTICLTAQDGGSFDLSPDAKEVTLSVVLAR